ncbi:MAG TPA: hypothetical protein VFG43_04075 [Geminicoccaceae bacterium]|nr:hypothetical protein [Geminicoccaceae bacterium]
MGRAAGRAGGEKGVAAAAALAALPAALAPALADAASPRHKYACVIEQSAALLGGAAGTRTPGTGEAAGTARFRFILTLERNFEHLRRGDCATPLELRGMLECHAPLRLRTAPLVIDEVMFGDGRSFFGPYGNSRMTLRGGGGDGDITFEASWSTIPWAATGEIDSFAYRGRCESFTSPWSE